MLISKKEITELERIKRLNLINSISGIKPANLIGTINENGISNLAIFSSVVHLGSSPALLGMILRPNAEVRRHTYENILSKGYYTINHVHKEISKNAHYTSAKFKDEESEFNTCKLTEQFIDDFPAPFVEESKIKVGLSYQQSIPIKANNTILVIGEIENIILPDDVFSETGMLDLSKTNNIGVSGLNTYYELAMIQSFPYARVEELPTF